MSNITLRAISEHTGLSVPTISQALNNTGRISIQTRKLVQDAASQMGFRPNAAAQAMTAGRFNAVGLLMGQYGHQSAFVGDFLRGLHDFLETKRNHLTLTFLEDAALTDENNLPHILTKAMVDGLVINYTHAIPAAMVDLVARYRIPAVWFNSLQAHNCVHFDDEGGAYKATRHLLERGHRRIEFSDITRRMETAREVHYSHTAREAGYTRAMLEAGLTPAVFTPSDLTVGLDSVRRLRGRLLSPDRPTAVLCYGGDELGWVNAVFAAGLEPGKGLSLMTFGDSPAVVGASIGRVHMPQAEAGQAVARMLFQLIRAKKPHPSVAIPLELIDGDFVASPLAG